MLLRAVVGADQAHLLEVDYLARCAPDYDPGADEDVT